MRFRLVFAACAALALAGCTEMETPDGPTLLGRSHGAEENLCYTAEEVNEQVLAGAWPYAGSGSRSSNMMMYGRPVVTVVRRTQIGPQQKQSRIIYSNAPGARSLGMVVTQEGTDGWRYVPRAGRLDFLIFPSTSVGPLNWLALVLYNYEVRDVRRENVAGAPAWQLRLQPKHAGRPTKRIWLDAETYLPLRQELWGPDGRLLSATQVLKRPTVLTADAARAQTMPIGHRMGSVQVAIGDQEWLMSEEDLRLSLRRPVGRITAMPEGFMLVGAYLYRCPDTRRGSARWELTDGVATVNVIQTCTDIADMEGEDVPHDAQGPIRTIRRGDNHFIVRGNLSAEELTRIAESIVLE